MYEPIRSKSIHSTSGEQSRFPRHSREEELDIQLAGHLAALLALTDELRALSPADEAAGLDEAGRELSEHLRRLRGGSPVRAAAGAVHGAGLAALHRRAHALAGRALVVAASRADTGAAILAAHRMEAHAAAAGLAGSVRPTALAA